MRLIEWGTLRKISRAVALVISVVGSVPSYSQLFQSLFIGLLPISIYGNKTVHYDLSLFALSVVYASKTSLIDHLYMKNSSGISSHSPLMIFSNPEIASSSFTYAPLNHVNCSATENG